MTKIVVHCRLFYNLFRNKIHPSNQINYTKIINMMKKVIVNSLVYVIFPVSIVFCMGVYLLILYLEKDLEKIKVKNTEV